MKIRFGGSALLLLSLALISCVPWTVRPIESETETADAQSTDSPAAYVEAIWESKLVPAISAAAVEVRTLLDALAASPQNAFARYGHREAGGPVYFIVSGKGLVIGIDDKSRNGLALVDVAPFDRRPDLSIQIGPVMRGSSLRDATGIVRFSDFINQLHFADVGNELNNRILKTVLAPLSKVVLPGRAITFMGTLAAENNVQPPLRGLIPVKLTVEERQ